MTALPYLLHGTTLALAWFLLFNVVATAARRAAGGAG